MFSKAQKNLHQANNFNPPPGYYMGDNGFENKNGNYLMPSFARQERFEKKEKTNPGPGAYYNDRSEKIKKRIIEENKKKDLINKNGAQSEIKISSIPSIPKKSATRVYEELAPGILILHEEENENNNIGPGTYNINSKIGHKKPISHKINPEHKKKPLPPDPQVKIPTIAEEIRNEKRLLYKKNLIKSTATSKQMISPSDLCLEVIILREKLMRNDENPPPGLYYNQKYQSSFQEPDPDLSPEYQLMMGKAERFKDNDYEGQTDIGPGAYDSKNTQSKNTGGGYIAKEDRKMHDDKSSIPGPGSYKIESVKAEVLEAKGNYPPIFGCGTNRFYSADRKIDQTPGPGSYKLDGKRKKKQKYVKIKKNFYQSQTVKPQGIQDSQKQLFSKGGDKSRTSEEEVFQRKNRKKKNNHYFVSKVERFHEHHISGQEIGPSSYNYSNTFMKQSFNKNKNQYVGTRQQRFDGNRIRPNIGPGTYQVEKSLCKT